MRGIDLRVRYTRMVIENSFLELLQSKPVSKITVTEICAKAQINRATFYKHYLDVPQLLENLEEDLFQCIREVFGEKEINIEQFLVEMMNFTLDEKEKFWVLGSDNGDPNLMAKTFQVCYERAYPLMIQNLPDISDSQRQMLYHFVSQGSGGILTNWIHTGMKESPEEVASYIIRLCSAAIDGVMH